MWKLKSDTYNLVVQTKEESMYMVGNGYIGVRGCFEEGYPEGDTIRGTYINGLYEQVPMIHAETAFGFPSIQDKQPRLIDTQTCEIFLDGERAQMIQGRYHNYLRTIDYKKGESERKYTFKTKTGKFANLNFKRLASLSDRNFLIYKMEVQYEGLIELVSICDTNVENYTNTKDPRLGQSNTKLIECVSLSISDNIVKALMKTKNTQLSQVTLIEHIVNSTEEYSMENKLEDGMVKTYIQGRKQIILEKKCVFTDSLREKDTLNTAINYLKSNHDVGYQDFLNNQIKILEKFWNNSEIEIEGTPSVQDAIRFMQYQLLQSVGTDSFSNVSAKGLSGEGYEGHYFWDTEIYVIPVLMLNQPEKAKILLEYRYHILPYAIKRARELGHNKGAAYAWRTISGIECSGYFPAGTAQYHINADIAYAFIQYYLYTDDILFMIEKGAEVIFETARIWLEIGHLHMGKFHIHDVTGPDEYTAIVNNNYYTNSMAKKHLIWAYKLYDILINIKDNENSIMIKKLLKKIDLNKEEVDTMLKASENMLLIYDEKLGLYAQDDSFLSKLKWPFDKVDKTKKPLLLHFHPLTIYRHQVLKQADTVLAHMLVEEYADEQSIINAFNYYEPLTTHDSSLSSCIYGIIASRCGFTEKAYNYFLESMNLDLEDTHLNTKDGLHIANISGTILSLIYGFAGLRVHDDGLILRPNLPEIWKKLSFNIKYRGSLLRVIIKDEVEIELIEGRPVNIKVWDDYINIDYINKKYSGIVFDMDGVLTETSHAHYLAWCELAQSLNFKLPESLENKVRGISRMESLEIVLEYGGLQDDYSIEQKRELANIKNNLYLKNIAEYSENNLADGAIELLEYLKANDYKIALASASRNAPFLLRAMNIESFFDAVVNPEEIAKGKPAPDIFLKACEKIGLNPEECLGVEDAYAGIESIKSAGLKSLGIGSKLHLSNCDLVFSNLNELLKHIKKYY